MRILLNRILRYLGLSPKVVDDCSLGRHRWTVALHKDEAGAVEVKFCQSCGVKDAD